MILNNDLDNINLMIDNEFSQEYQYYKGQYCVYNGTLYRARNDIPVGTPFSTDNWEYRQIGLDLYQINNNITIKNIDTGITGLTAYKCGKVAMLRYYGTITATSAGWINIGNLPDSLIPITNVESIAIDNDASSFSSTHYSNLRIIRSTGDVTVYLFKDKLTLYAIFSVTYITAN